jgi:hypothetical protein
MADSIFPILPLSSFPFFFSRLSSTFFHRLFQFLVIIPSRVWLAVARPRHFTHIVTHASHPIAHLLPLSSFFPQSIVVL